jgi:hypothetical protein
MENIAARMAPLQSASRQLANSLLNSLYTNFRFSPQPPTDPRKAHLPDADYTARTVSVKRASRENLLIHDGSQGLSNSPCCDEAPTRA